MTDAKKIALETSLDTRPVKDGFQEIVQAAESTAAGVKNASDRAGKAVDSIGSGADAAAKKIEGAERSIIASIQRRTAAVQAAGQSESKYYEELAKQRGVNVDTLRPYLHQLDAAKARQDAASASLGKMGVSAAQTAAALRGVPAQFTDIVTSIASGQQPLTVLLQQGGQLKDMFGGAGNAARALGGYVAGLVNPFTLAAGALAAFAAAAYQGSSELQNFNKTLILSGGQAGVTGDQLMSMAAGIDAISSSVTQSKAAEALNGIVEAGVRGEAQIKRYALAAAEFEAAGGGAAAEVAKQFAALGKDPLSASLKLTESMGYLTAETYKQIKALEDQGRSLDAARVAQDAYASALEGKTPALMQNLGLIERGWAAVKNGAKEAWDAMLNVGRADTLSDQVAAVEKRLAAARANPLIGSGNAQATGRRRQAEDELLLGSLREQQRLAARAADLQATRAASEKARIAWMQEGDKYLSKEAQMEREIAKIKAQGLAAGASELEIEKRIAALREKNATKPRTTRAARDEFGDVFNRVTLKDAGLDPSFYKDLNTLYDGYQKGRIGVDQYREAVESLVSVQRFAVEAQKDQTAAAIASAQASNAAFDAEFESIEKKRLSVEAQIRTGREMLEQIQFETSLLGMNTAQREQAIAMRELKRAGLVAGTQAYEAYAEQIKSAIINREQQQASIDAAKAAANEWQKTSDSIEGFLTDALKRGFESGKSFGENLGDSVSNYFKTTVAEAIASAITKAIMSALASTEWGRFFSSVLGGGGGGNLGTSLLSSAAQNYMTGGSALGASGNAVGAWATGSMSTANMAGSIYANYTGAGIDGLLATNGAYGTAASGSAAGASSATWISAVGYAALIAAAVVVAENLYSKGYTRTAVGKGPGETNRFGYTSFTSDPNMGNSTAYNISPENRTRMIFDSLGMSEKWADIFSGTTRMGTLFGRKLGAYGYEADIAGGDAEVSGFARYKGGLFRSNKTVGIDIDPRDAANIDAMVEAQIEGSRNMAKAMGLSSEAIDAYTGSIKINMKGAKTAEEQAERAAKAMDDLNYELIKTASGGKLAREDFKQFMEGIQQDIQQAGISAAGIADILLAGMTGRLSGADVGAQLSDMILGGIYDAIAGSAAAQISQLFMTQIITPIFTAIASGVPVSQAVSAAAMKQTVETARQYMATVSAIFNDPEFQAWVAEFKGELNRLGGDAARVAAPSMRTYGPSPAQLAAEETKREREQLERELLRLQGNTVELRKRELAALKPVNRALQEQIWALEDVNSLKDAWTGLTDSIEEEIKRLRGVVLGESSAGLAYLQAQFATTTAQARAMDQAAAGRLPELSGQLAELYLNSSTSASDYQARINSLAASLEETNRITRSTAGITADGTQKVKDEQTQQQIKLLQQSIDVLTATLQEGNKSAAITASALNKASTPAGLRTVPA